MIDILGILGKMLLVVSCCTWLYKKVLNWQKSSYKLDYICPTKIEQTNFSSCIMGIIIAIILMFLMRYIPFLNSSIIISYINCLFVISLTIGTIILFIWPSIKTYNSMFKIKYSQNIIKGKFFDDAGTPLS